MAVEVKNYTPEEAIKFSGLSNAVKFAKWAENAGQIRTMANTPLEPIFQRTLEDGTEVNIVADETFKKVARGFAAGAASELIADGFSHEVHQVIEEAKAS